MRTHVKTAVFRHYLLRMLTKHMSFHSDFCLHAVSYHLEVTMTLTMTMVMLLVMAYEDVGASHLHKSSMIVTCEAWLAEGGGSEGHSKTKIHTTS